jgi:predicted ArsR family transcriptional regulator
MSFIGLSHYEQEREIITFLRKNREGYTIKDIAKKLKCHKITASKRLHKLLSENKIKMRRIGRYKLFYPLKRIWFFTNN